MPKASDSYTYFAAADRQAENVVDDADFDRHLILSLLFHHPLIVPDIFLYISRRLAKHLFTAGHRTSLFEEAVNRNLIVPHFRQSAGSFADNLAEIERLGIRGVLRSEDRFKVAGTNVTAREVADRLDATIHETPSAVWGTNVGEGYGNRMMKALWDSRLPLGLRLRKDFLKVWEETEEWRKSVLEKALERSARTDGGGLRRGDVMQELAVAVGVRAVDDERGVDDVSSILRGTRGSELKRAKAFIQWMNECYYYNQAASLGEHIEPSFPKEDVSTALVPRLMLEEVIPPPGRKSPNRIRLAVSLPPIRTLQQADPADLLEIREGAGEEYRHSLTEWQSSGSTQAERMLRKATTDYAVELSTLVRTTVDEPKTWLEMRFGNHSLRFVQASSPLAAEAAGQWMGLPPLVSTAAAVGVIGGYETLSLFSQRSRRSSVPVRRVRPSADFALRRGSEW